LQNIFTAKNLKFNLLTLKKVFILKKFHKIQVKVLFNKKFQSSIDLILLLYLNKTIPTYTYLQLCEGLKENFLVPLPNEYNNLFLKKYD
jgi:hypothetical protein